MTVHIAHGLTVTSISGVWEKVAKVVSVSVHPVDCVNCSGSLLLCGFVQWFLGVFKDALTKRWLQDFC